MYIYHICQGRISGNNQLVVNAGEQASGLETMIASVVGARLEARPDNPPSYSVYISPSSSIYHWVVSNTSWPCLGSVLNLATTLVLASCWVDADPGSYPRGVSCFFSVVWLSRSLRCSKTHTEGGSVCRMIPGCAGGHPWHWQLCLMVLQHVELAEPLTNL